MEDRFIEEVRHQENLIAIIIYSDYRGDGLSFFTPENFSQQLAYMHHPTGKIIDRHVHNHVSREVSYTQEVLVLKSGKLQVDLYTDERVFLTSKTLNAGDLILLASGGHGVTVVEEAELFEIKQGPYAGDADKERF